MRSSGDFRNYALVTGAYWADTIVDGASRVLVLFYFYERGYSPFAIASLFLFYEIFGIVTNLVGGWLAARFGLRATLLGGLAVQLVALAMLAAVPASWLVVPYVMAAQALSGIAKDLTKMSSKSAVKLVVPGDAPATLYKWVAILTGSKNALKGVGGDTGHSQLRIAGRAWRPSGPCAAVTCQPRKVTAGRFCDCGGPAGASSCLRCRRVNRRSPALHPSGPTGPALSWFGALPVERSGMGNSGPPAR